MLSFGRLALLTTEGREHFRGGRIANSQKSKKKNRTPRRKGAEKTNSGIAAKDHKERKKVRNKNLTGFCLGCFLRSMRSLAAILIFGFPSRLCVFA